MPAFAPLARTLALALLLLAAPATGETPLGCPDPVVRDGVAALNAERAALGVAPLALDVRLLESAQLHAEYLMVNSEVSSSGSGGSSFSQRMEAAGYTPWTRTAESVAGGPMTAADVISVWMGSLPDRARLLDPALQHVGLGHAENSFSLFRHYWVLDLGAAPGGLLAPLGACPACSDAADNDGDGAIDHPADPQCASATQEREQFVRRGCGVGWELALALPLLAALRRRRRTRS